jgi:transcriptional regulator with XRE-family HTH domain
MNLSTQKQSEEPMAGEMTGPESLRKLLGKRIRELRTQQGCSQKEFADSCSIAPDRLERIERGEIELTLSAVVQLAQKLGTNASAIFEGIG